jgi:hypothetical protein
MSYSVATLNTVTIRRGVVTSQSNGMSLVLRVEIHHVSK